MFHTLLKSSAIALALCSFIPNEAIANASYIDQTEGKLSYLPSENAMADVNNALEKAKEHNKLTLVVMGANWCHDSQSFLRKLESQEMQQLVSNRYEVVIVDVGYLENGKDIIQRFGMPVIYGTPTVLVIDPQSGKPLNTASMHQWRDADSYSLDETLKYFAAYTSASKPELISNDKLATLYAEIDAFEAKQSARVYRAFNIIGPMLDMERDERPKEFNSYWGQLRDFRYAITEDLKTLKDEAKARIEAGENNISLKYPSYKAFDWEKTTD